MSILNSVRDIIRAYGSAVTVCESGKKTAARAFIQPLRNNSRYYVGGEYHKAGFVSTDRYLYIGSPDVLLYKGNTVIETASKKYIVKKSEIYRVGDRCVYVWAILAPYGGILEDEYESD